MAIKTKSYLSKKSDMTLTYSNMRGVDFSADGEDSKRYRFKYLQNMYRDYDGDGARIIESIPGFRKLFSVGERINGIFSHKKRDGTPFYIIHAGRNFYSITKEGIESGASPTLRLSARDAKSTAVKDGTSLYIFDGSSIFKVTYDEVFYKVSDLSKNSAPYVPTLFINGKEYEQRNLLTSKFKELYGITLADEITSGSEGITYRIVSREDKTCVVSGMAAGYGGEITIPSRVSISGEEYLVWAIEDKAFYENELITKVVISEGPVNIGKLSFSGCDNLTEIILPDSINYIGNSAFADNKKLTHIHIGTGLISFGYSVFVGCPMLKEIDYALDEDSFKAINGNSVIADRTVNYKSTYSKISVRIPLYSPAESITDVNDGEGSLEYEVEMNGTLVNAIILRSETRNAFDGKEVTIEGTLSPTHFTKSKSGTSFYLEEGLTVSGPEAIKGCTVVTSFDGRIFISGNPRLPNTVFYSSRDETGRNNPLYFGELNYFNDGIGTFPVISMLQSGEALLVFKSDGDGDGSIYYHTAHETGIDILPKIYPVSYIHNGISASGGSISFFDDPIFVSPLGICALEKQAINLERSVAVRSHNVNPRLLSEDLSNINLTKWCGYLVVEAGSNIYLADSRATFTHSTGYKEYEWFYLTGIGTYKNDRAVFRYESLGKDEYLLHPDIDKVVTETVYSEI